MPPVIINTEGVMKTPIADFITKYLQSDATRLHMPGHKGNGFFGFEGYDITEIQGADVLYSADGIIAESENNCSTLFGTAHSFYSAEGSSLAIKAMLSLAVTASGEERPTVLAARNAHKAFLYAAAWLDFHIQWLTPSVTDHLCACKVTKEEVENAILTSEKKPCAVYLTSPDYLGNLADIKGIAEVCKAHKIPLLVDNAHGAYLKFLKQDLHPVTLGATMCCDSAHKTLPVLTGGSYLHIAQGADAYFVENARNALASFASTSPSYLILASLDQCNAYLSEAKEAFATCEEKVGKIKDLLSSCGCKTLSDEPFKLTIPARELGFTGEELADYLRENKIECEFADEDYLVLMFSPQNRDIDYQRVEKALFSAINEDRKKLAVKEAPPYVTPPTRLTPRQAILARSETIPTKEAEGRIASSPTVSCPPAIPIVISGEVITKDVIDRLRYYGIHEVAVVKE